MEADLNKGSLCTSCDLPVYHVLKVFYFDVCLVFSCYPLSGGKKVIVCLKKGSKPLRPIPHPFSGQYDLGAALGPVDILVLRRCSSFSVSGKFSNPLERYDVHECRVVSVAGPDVRAFPGRSRD